jgi:hypothetical protein
VSSSFSMRVGVLFLTNTSNTPRSHNSATADVETGSKLIEHRGGRPFVKMSVNCDVVGTWSTRT